MDSMAEKVQFFIASMAIINSIALLLNHVAADNLKQAVVDFFRVGDHEHGDIASISKLFISNTLDKLFAGSPWSFKALLRFAVFVTILFLIVLLISANAQRQELASTLDGIKSAGLYWSASGFAAIIALAYLSIVQTYYLMKTVLVKNLWGALFTAYIGSTLSVVSFLIIFPLFWTALILGNVFSPTRALLDFHIVASENKEDPGRSSAFLSALRFEDQELLDGLAEELSGQDKQGWGRLSTLTVDVETCSPNNIVLRHSSGDLSGKSTYCNGDSGDRQTKDTAGAYRRNNLYVGSFREKGLKKEEVTSILKEFLVSKELSFPMEFPPQFFSRFPIFYHRQHKERTDGYLHARFDGVNREVFSSVVSVLSFDFLRIGDAGWSAIWDIFSKSFDMTPGLLGFATFGGTYVTQFYSESPEYIFLNLSRFLPLAGRAEFGDIMSNNNPVYKIYCDGSRYDMEKFPIGMKCNKSIILETFKNRVGGLANVQKIAQLKLPFSPLFWVTVLASFLFYGSYLIFLFTLKCMQPFLSVSGDGSRLKVVVKQRHVEKYLVYIIFVIGSTPLCLLIALFY